MLVSGVWHNDSVIYVYTHIHTCIYSFRGLTCTHCRVCVCVCVCVCVFGGAVQLVRSYLPDQGLKLGPGQ